MNRARLKKEKRKRVLVLSAGGQGSGMQGLYLEIEESGWHTIAHAIIPYPDMPRLNTETDTLSTDDLACLDRRISLLFLECAEMIRAKSPGTQRKPHLIVLDKLTYFRRSGGTQSSPEPWVIELGSPIPLLTGFQAPIITDFALTGIANGSGQLPLQAGMSRLAAGSSAFVSINLGLVSRAIGVDAPNSRILFDSDTGPGTCLLNRAVRESGHSDGFDRDGALAATGTVNHECLNALCADQWLLLNAPKRAAWRQFESWYDHPGLKGLNAADRVATLTALTARSVFEFIKREFRDLPSLEQVWISGGGAHNRTLLEYLRTFFNPVSVRTVDEMGIPVEGMVPLALGLTVCAKVEGKPWCFDGSISCTQQIGTWIEP